MKGFTTKAVHGVPLKKDVYGALRRPIYESVAFEFDNSQDIQLAFEGKKPAHVYSRSSNPTVEDFEHRIKLLADAFAVVAFNSGMAAIVNAVMALSEAGSNIVTTRHLFGNTYSLFTRTFANWGLQTRLVDLSDLTAIERAIDDQTRAIFFETVTNPQLEVVDARAIAALAHKHAIPVIADGTLTTPYLFKSRDFDIDIEVVSTTKFISGGATAVGGVLIDNGLFDWSLAPNLKVLHEKFAASALITKVRREINRNMGTFMAPHNAALKTLGLETLALRIDKCCDNTLRVASYLKRHPKIVAVNYPGLKESLAHKIAAEQFQNRFGAILTFDLETRDACFRFMDALKLIRRATNLNDNKTLVIHPASTIFCEFPPEERLQMHVGEGMIRLAVGIEDCEDIIADLEQGLKVC